MDSVKSGKVLSGFFCLQVDGTENKYFIIPSVKSKMVGESQLDSRLLCLSIWLHSFTLTATQKYMYIDKVCSSIINLVLIIKFKRLTFKQFYIIIPLTGHTYQ